MPSQRVEENLESLRFGDFQGLPRLEQKSSSEAPPIYADFRSSITLERIFST